MQSKKTKKSFKEGQQEEQGNVTLKTPQKTQSCCHSSSGLVLHDINLQA